MRFEIIKAELEKQPDEELHRLARSLGAAEADRQAIIEALCWILAPRGPKKKPSVKLTTV